MIRALKLFAEWLDKRFPPKARVTQEQYDALQRDYDRLLVVASEARNGLIHAEDRIATMEKSVAAIKDLLARNGNITVKSEAEKLRDQFVKGDFGRGPSA